LSIRHAGRERGAPLRGVPPLRPAGRLTERCTWRRSLHVERPGQSLGSSSVRAAVPAWARTAWRRGGAGAQRVTPNATPTRWVSARLWSTTTSGPCPRNCALPPDGGRVTGGPAGPEGNPACGVDSVAGRGCLAVTRVGAVRPWTYAAHDHTGMMCWSGLGAASRARFCCAVRCWTYGAAHAECGFTPCPALPNGPESLPSRASDAAGPWRAAQLT